MICKHIALADRYLVKIPIQIALNVLNIIHSSCVRAYEKAFNKIIPVEVKGQKLKYSKAKPL